MKNTIKIIAMMFVIIGFITLPSCNNNPEKKKTQEPVEATADHGDHGHEHIFACPMHPEVKGLEGENCSKCGMPLEHMDEESATGNYQMQYSSSPQKIEAGKEVSLSFTPRNKDNNTQAVPLDVEHEKKIHLILVNEDLSWFDHIHPEYQADGSYKVNEKFPNGGNYILYADYKPAGGSHQLEKINVVVEGKKAEAVNYTKSRNTAKSGDFAVTLKPDDGKFISNSAIHFDGAFVLNGKVFDVNDLQNYLGAKGHMVGINLKTKEYMHLHPEVEGNILHFHTTFEAAGMYRVWLQFMHEEKLHTVDFILEVAEGVAAKGESHAHGEHDHQH